MKLKDIDRFIFLNPSPNMSILARKVSQFGRNVLLCYNKERINLNSNKLSICYDDKYFFYDLSSNEKEFTDRQAYRFKKWIFEKSPDVSSLPFRGGLRELYLLGKGKILAEQPANIAEFNGNLSDKDIVITSYTPISGIKKATKKYIEIYELDEDILKTLMLSYFVFFIKDLKYEMFISGNKLYVVGDKDSNILFKNRLPFLLKNGKKKTNEYSLFFNNNSYLVNFEKKYILLNDFSYFNISVKMPDEWYERLGQYLCTGKL